MQTKIYKETEYKKIIEDLLNGEVVGFPTDTVYGLAIVYNNKEAFKKLYEIKNRNITKPISMMVSSINVMNEVAYIDNMQEKIISNLMPGALTVILKAKENLPDFVTFNYQTIGIRIPTNDVALNILKEINMPLLVTSANISSQPSLIKFNDVYDNFKGKIKSLIALDAQGDCASTVVDITNDKINVLRKGPISLEKIMKVLEEE